MFCGLGIEVPTGSAASRTMQLKAAVLTGVPDVQSSSTSAKIPGGKVSPPVRAYAIRNVSSVPSLLLSRSTKIVDPLCPVTIVSLVSSVSKPFPGMLTVAGYVTSMRMLASAGRVRGSYGTVIRAMMPFGPHVALDGMVVDVVVVGALVDVVVLVGAVVLVVGAVVVVVVVEGTVVVVVEAPGSRSATTSSTNASTRASTAVVSAKVGQGAS